jgi:hypothetical protein
MNTKNDRKQVKSLLVFYKSFWVKYKIYVDNDINI